MGVSWRSENPNRVQLSVSVAVPRVAGQGSGELAFFKRAVRWRKALCRSARLPDRRPNARAARRCRVLAKQPGVRSETHRPPRQDKSGSDEESAARWADGFDRRECALRALAALRGFPPHKNDRGYAPREDAALHFATAFGPNPARLECDRLCHPVRTFSCRALGAQTRSSRLQFR